MATGFQNVINNAETISIHRRKNVSTTQARDGTVRSVSLGGQKWQFDVKLPDGAPWTTYRPIIESIENLDRVTTSTIQINSAGHAWMTGYQGNLVSAQQANIVVSYATATPTTLTITSGGTGLIAGQYRFKAGDFIQLGTTGAVYSVVEDVAHNGTTIKVHRPIREAAGSYTLVVGQNVKWTVLCTRFPQWTLFDRNQVSWDGSFQFVEV